MFSCSWSLSLALGFPQSELPVATFKYRWNCNPWFAIAKLPFWLNLSLWLSSQKHQKRMLFCCISFWNYCWEISEGQSGYFVGDTVSVLKVESHSTLFRNTNLHLTGPSIPLSWDVFLSEIGRVL